MSILLFRKSPTQRALALLRRKSATVWLPGTGSVQGLQANNYLLSDGSTGLTAVDGVLGLDLDAMGALGPELVVNGGPFTATTGWNADAATLSVVGSELLVTASAAGAQARQDFTLIPGDTYKLTGTYRKSGTGTGGQLIVQRGAAGSWAAILYTTNETAGVNLNYSGYFVATGSDVSVCCRASGGLGAIANFSRVSLEQVTGIHLTQATTANKLILRKTGNVWWFDTTAGTKTLGATFPAGHESDIVIDAAKTGATVATAQNLTGAYTINTDTCGRIILPGTVAAPATLTAGETALLTAYANRLAGL